MPQRAEGLHLHPEASAARAGAALNPSLPPSLPGEELLLLNWRMLQAPADELEESCGKVKASWEAACSCRGTRHPTATRAQPWPVSPPGL